MSRFYGSVWGRANTQATREGTEDSGIEGHIRGWDVGVRIIGRVEGGRDTFEIFVTAGSNDPHDYISLGTAYRNNLGQLTCSLVEEGVL